MENKPLKLSQVFFILPWTYKIVVVVSIAFFAMLFVHALGFIVESVPRDKPGAAEVQGLSDRYSIFDPSATAAEGKGVLAYTVVKPLPGKEAEKSGAAAPFIGIAQAQNASCLKWTPAGDVFSPTEDTIVAPDGETTIAAGMWSYETPGLVYDPGDTGREWKLYAYRYMWTASASFETARRYGMIALKTAPAPEGPWSKESWVFGAQADWPPPPYQDLIPTKVSALDPSLADIVAYTRPSPVSAGPGVIVMALSGFTAGRTPDRVVMMASHDHGRTWRYMGTPLTVADAGRVGTYTTLNGATLLRQGGRIYLAAVFGGSATVSAGTFLFEFEDINKGLIRREKDGKPVLMKQVPLSSLKPTDLGGGFAAYTDACEKAGLLTGEMSGIRGRLQIFRTLQALGGK